jgi:hypothetical protein
MFTYSEGNHRRSDLEPIQPAKLVPFQADANTLPSKLTLPNWTPTDGLRATFQPAWSMIASLPMRLDLE